MYQTPYTLFGTMLLLCISLTMSYSQTTFSQNFEIINTAGYRSGLSTAIADVNGDGRDDITRVTNRNILEVNFGSGNKTQLHLNQFDAAIPAEAWNITIGDLDNKGCNEIALGTIYKGGYIFGYDEKTQRLELLQTTAKDFYSQGANMVDINNDGFLDWFICDDESDNDIFLNDGTGNLMEADDFIDMSTHIKSDNSGNYASDWVDIDSDGDLDFYISKCRSSALSNTDPRRINQLFINDGQNNFEEQAEAYGLANGAQTWATSFGDLDNDGDLDAVSVNHGQVWNMYENIENDTFVDHPEKLNSLSGFAIQCILRDFDNNGYLDVLVTGSNHYLWYNQGDLNFELDRKPFKDYVATNFSTGDINHDGFLDIYVAYTDGYNDAGSVDDILYLNDTNANNWIGLRLSGKESNKNGIGARIRVYSKELGWQIRDIRSGESYGIMNSLNSIFGLADDTRVDTIEVIWPSGQIDRFEDVKPGQYYTISEGTCIVEDDYVTLENDATLCEDSRVLLTGPKNAYDHWSNAEQDDTNSEYTEVLTSGLYTMGSYKDDGCEVKVPSVVVNNYNPADYDQVIDVSRSAACKGDEVTLKAKRGKAFAWSTGEDTQSIVVDSASVYSVIVVDHCDEVHQEIAQIAFIDPTPLQIQSDTIEKGETAVLKAEGPQISWYWTETEDKEMYIGKTLEIPNIEETTTIYVEGEQNISYESVSIGEKEWQGVNKYADASLNGGMLFDVHETTILESVDVYTDSIGPRTFQILSSENELVFEIEQTLEIGKNTIQLDHTLYPGKGYVLTTDGEKNIETFGFRAPRLQRSNSATKYPYNESELLWLTNSRFGPRFVMYFYNWKIRRAESVCKSERIPVRVMVDFNSSVHFAELNDFHFYPNPSDGIVYIQNIQQIKLKDLAIFDNQGQMLFRKSDLPSGLMKIDLGPYPANVYSVLIRDHEGNSFLKRLVKLK